MAHRTAVKQGGVASRAAHNGKLHEAARRGELTSVEAFMTRKELLDGRSYAIAVSASADAGDVQSALRWLRASAERGDRFAPEVEACTACVKAACIAGACEIAKKLIEAMANHTENLQYGIPKLVSSKAKPNGRTIATFLRGCLWHGWTEHISWILARSKAWQIQLEAQILTYAVNSLASALRPAEATALNCQSAEAYAAIARAHAVLGEVEEFESARSMGYSELVKNKREAQEFMTADDNRAASNTAYRRHRNQETEALLKHLVATPSIHFALNHLRRSLVVEKNTLKPALRLGLAETEFRLARQALATTSRTERKRSTRSARLALETRENLLTESLRDRTFVRRYCFPQLNTDSSSNLSLYCELGAGDGEFAIRRASNDQKNTCWLINELRHHRAAAIVAHSVLSKLENTATVAGSAHTLLDALPDSCLDGCFVNFPQPPTQVCLTIDPAIYDTRHMLDIPLFVQLARVLKPSAYITIATDNSSYANLLAAIAKEANAQNDSVHLLPDDGHTYLSVMAGTADDNTYFDRLWQTGCSQHSQAKRRFLIRLFKQRLIKSKDRMQKKRGRTDAVYSNRIEARTVTAPFSPPLPMIEGAAVDSDNHHDDDRDRRNKKKKATKKKKKKRIEG